jgi:hypothetical protein
MIRAGTPPIVTLSWNDAVTTAFAPTVAPSPIAEPATMVTLLPIKQSAPIAIGATFIPELLRGTPGCRRWFMSRIETRSATKVPLPIEIRVAHAIVVP